MLLLVCNPSCCSQSPFSTPSLASPVGSWFGACCDWPIMFRSIWCDWPITFRSIWCDWGVMSRKYHYLVFHREYCGTAQTVQISEMGRDIIWQKGDGASHHHSGENNTDPMWRMPPASNTRVRERNFIISKTKKLFQRLTYWTATSSPEHFNVDHSCDAGGPGTQWTVRILYSHCQNAAMQSEHNQGSSILASLGFIELHVTQDHFVKPSRCVTFQTIPFLDDICGQPGNIVDRIISSFWSHVFKSRYYVLSSHMPLARLY